MAKQKLRGSGLMVFVEGKAIALATNISLTLTTNYQEERTFDDQTGDMSEPDYVSWSVSADALIGTGVANSTGLDVLIQKQIDMEQVKLVIGVKGDNVSEDHAAISSVPDTGWMVGRPLHGIQPRVGMATIETLNPSGEVNGSAKYSVTFKGIGKLEVYTPEVESE